MSSLNPTAGESQSSPQPTTGVLLIQLGTPHEPKSAAVRRFLREFLSDERVLDVAAPLRFFLVNGVIAPFRTPGSTKIYRTLWELGGGESPIRVHTQALTEQLNERFAEEPITVHMAMRYQGPSIEDVLEEMRAANYTKLVVLPLFPHYASSSTGTALQRGMEVVSSWWAIPGLELINQFYEEGFYLDTLAEQAKKHDVGSFDHVVMSYHGLPEQHVDKVYPGRDDLCEQHNCEEGVEAESALCYKATCFETSRLLAERLDLSASDYTVSFQSRLSDRWLTPFSDQVIEELAKAGKKRLLVLSPAFVADCLETLVEVGVEYQELFVEHGGEKVQLVASCNTEPTWVDGLASFLRKHRAQ